MLRVSSSNGILRPVPLPFNPKISVESSMWYSAQVSQRYSILIDAYGIMHVRCFMSSAKLPWDLQAQAGTGYSHGRQISTWAARSLIISLIVAQTCLALLARPRTNERLFGKPAHDNFCSFAYVAWSAHACACPQVVVFGSCQH